MDDLNPLRYTLSAILIPAESLVPQIPQDQESGEVFEVEIDGDDGLTGASVASLAEKAWWSAFHKLAKTEEVPVVNLVCELCLTSTGQIKTFATRYYLNLHLEGTTHPQTASSAIAETILRDYRDRYNCPFCLFEAAVREEVLEYIKVAHAEEFTTLTEAVRGE